MINIINAATRTLDFISEIAPGALICTLFILI